MRVRGWFWLSILILIGLVSLFAPQLAPADPLNAVSGESLRPPSMVHLLGTDLIGRDVFSRLLYGGQRTLSSAVLALLIAVVPGGLIGLVIGYVGGAPDVLIGAILDALLAFPALLLALTVIALVGSGPVAIAFAVGLSGMPSYARVTRTATRTIQSAPYIEAARAIGERPVRVIFVHILPNTWPTLLSMASVIFSWAILNGAALAFLGYASDPSIPDWGVMLAAGRQILPVAPWEAFASGMAITLTILAANQLADALSMTR